MDEVTSADPAQHRENSSKIQEAIAAFQRGHDKERNFQFLVERFYGPVLRFLSRWTSCEEDRQDIAQEVFLRIYKSLQGYRGEAQFGTWVFQVTHNTCVRWLGRTSAVHPGEGARLLPLDEAYEDALTVPADPLPRNQLEELIVREDAEHLREIIASLPEKMRRCVELQVYQELRYHEIAAALRLSIGTVKAHLFHARERLRDRLNGTSR